MRWEPFSALPTGARGSNTTRSEGVKRTQIKGKLELFYTYNYDACNESAFKTSLIEEQESKWTTYESETTWLKGIK